MYGENSHSMPIGLAMSLSSNPEAFRIFLGMSNEEQDNLVNHAKELKSVRELQLMVDNLPKKYGIGDPKNSY